MHTPCANIILTLYYFHRTLLRKIKQSLSVDPVNGHVVEMLNVALEYVPETPRAKLPVDNATRFLSADRELKKSAAMISALKAVKVGVARGAPSWRDPVQPEERLRG